MIKASIPQEDITTVNIYVPNIEAPKYMKQMLIDMNGEISSNTVTLGGFNIPLISITRSSEQ